MRRSDREITDTRDIIEILDSCDVCRLAMSQDDFPYVVPMNFAFDFENDRLTLYFHCARQGKKLDIIAKNPNVCFEVDCAHELVKGESVCHYSMKYQSVIGTGIAELITDNAEKSAAMTKIMRRYAPEAGEGFMFPAHALEAVAVICVRVDTFTGKANQ